MPHVILLTSESASVWTLQNKFAEVLVERATGRLRGLSVKRGKKKVDLFQQLRGKIPGYIGGLRIFDELERKHYDDFHSDPRVLDAKLDARGTRLTLIKTYANCPFQVQLELRLDGSTLEWDVTLTQDASVNRGVRVFFFVPLIAGWYCWTAANTRQDGAPQGLNDPWIFDGMSSFDFMYNQGPYVGDREVCVPVFSTYDSATDAGFTFADCFERNVPASKFQFINGERTFNWGFQEQPNLDELPYFEHVHYHIGLHGRKPCQTGGLIFMHGGHWRPGLGQVYGRYRDFFDPPVKEIWERQGTFECGSIFTADKVEEFKSFGGKYLEVHGHFPFYGDYYYEGAKSWKSIGQLENERLGRPVKNNRRLSRALILEKLKVLQKAGISSHYYTNYTDGYIPWIEKKHPDSIVTYEDGKPAPSGWRFCHCINPDPDFSYGRFAIASTKKILARLGKHLDGFFLDCFRHFDLDFAHSDGVTMVNNKPAFSVNWALSRIQERIGKLLQRQRKDCFANKPRTVQNMRHVDGVLLEGQGDGAEVKYFFTCIAKPLFFMWTGLKKPQEEYLKRSVVYGGWPRDPVFRSKTPAELEREKRALRLLYARYLPLYKLFAGRVLCFEPDPITFSDGVYGQLYTLPDGSYLAGCMTDWISTEDTLHYAEPKELRFRLPRGERLNEVFVFYPGDPNPQRVMPVDAGVWRVVRMDRYRGCAAVLIREGDQTARARGDLRDTRDYCGDPVSAFEMGTGNATGG
ncbi:MAG: hypothetical protein AMXMBFR7_46320 [Planctomycetota bacterium]